MQWAGRTEVVMTLPLAVDDTINRLQRRYTSNQRLNEASTVIVAVNAQLLRRARL